MINLIYRIKESSNVYKENNVSYISGTLRFRPANSNTLLLVLSTVVSLKTLKAALPHTHGTSETL